MKTVSIVSSVALLISLAILRADAFGQQSLSVPDDSKFVVQLDLATFSQTELGSKLLEMTEKMAQQEVGDGEDVMQTIEETLGMNPFQEVQSLTIVGTDYESPEENLRLVLKLRKTSGNLEGLMLTAPGYAAEEHDDVTIHSAKEADFKAFAAIHSSRSGDKTVVAATQKSDVIELLESLDGGSSGRKRREIRWSVPDGTFAQIQILELPSEVYDVDPAANIAKLIQDLAISMRETDGEYVVDANLTTEEDKQAEQIEQLVVGAKALVGLFESQIEDEEEAKMLMGLLDSLGVKRKGSSIQISIAVPEESIMKFLKEEADLPL